MSAVVTIAEQPQSEATALIQAIERAALNPAVDVDKMERLFALQERMMARNAEMAFTEAMRSAQAEMPKIYRNKENKQTNSYYADLEKVAEAAVPIYTKHGFALSYGQADCPIADHIRITCRISHNAGHSRNEHADVPLDLAGLKGNANKTPTHAFGSTVSYGRRYLVVMIFNITLTNEDNDGNNKAQPTAPNDYEDWKADMTALADEGLTRLEAGWKKSAPDLRKHAIAVDGDWWAKMKTKAQQVQQ